VAMLWARGLLRPHESWKGEGRYKGRAPTARAKPANIVRLASGGAKCEDNAKRLGVGVASVYRVLAAEKAETTISNAL
jgi:DNA invertase Pin-like site-specific DNA recombinase